MHPTGYTRGTRGKPGRPGKMGGDTPGTRQASQKRNPCLLAATPAPATPPRRARSEESSARH
eukprot:11181082-Lingulodinium_polyedra.AAC.1